jgi:hypothetical protein
VGAFPHIFLFHPESVSRSAIELCKEPMADPDPDTDGKSGDSKM